MIVIGVDVHKHSLTAVAVDEVGRPVLSAPGGRRRRGRLVAVAGRALAVGAGVLPPCDARLERTLLAAG